MIREVRQDLRDLQTAPTEAELEARRAEDAKREAAEVAALVKRLNEIPSGWQWSWRGFALYYGPSAEADRVAAAYALGHQYKAYSAIPDLAAALKDKDEDIRINASSSLLEMADHASSAEAALRGVLNDPYNRVRLNAVRALAQMGVPSADLMPSLAGVVASTSLSNAVEAADLEISLGRDPKELVPVLMRGMDDKEVSEEVIDDLGEQYEDPAYLPILLRGLKSGDTKVRAGSISMLGGPTYASPEVTAALRQAASSWISDDRQSAAAALVDGGYGPDKKGTVAGAGTAAADASVATLVKLTRDWDSSVRRTAAESLGRSRDGSPEVVAALRKSLKDSDEDVREAAADALGAIGKPAKAAVPDLWNIWNDSRKPKAGAFAWVVGSAAARALMDMGEDVEDYGSGWYDARWDMDSSQVRAAFEKEGLAVAEAGGPPTVLVIDRMDCGCGDAAQCRWSCWLPAPAAEPEAGTIPVSVSFVFAAAGKLTRVELQSHLGDSSRCKEIGKALSGLEWTYSTTHTKAQVPSAATTWSYRWTLTNSTVAYTTTATPSACEMELVYAKGDSSR
jgi:HEAT repeat protein